MRRYDDRPMDLADALIVAQAQRLDDLDVLSFDSDFLIYRTADGRAMRRVPG